MPSNFFINNLLATMALTDDKPTAKKILCDNCDSEDAAQSRCNECGVFLCQFCTESHKRYRSTKHHEVLSMKELKSNPAPQTIAEKMRCSKHKEEMIKLFCKTCQTTICRDCTIVDHQGHRYGFVEEVAVDEKQKINEDLNRVKERKTKLVEGIANLTKFNESLDAKKKSTISEIHQHFDELTKEMVEKATSLTNSKQKEVRAQLEVLEMALASCESSIEFTEEAFKNGNDVQILSMEKYILQSLEQLKAVKDQTEPCVTQVMEFVIPSSVQKPKKPLITKYDVHVAVADPANCKASFQEYENCKASFKEDESRKVSFKEDENRMVSYKEEKKRKGSSKQRKVSLKDLKHEDCKSSFTGNKTVLDVGKKSFIKLICNDRKNRRMTHGGQVIKPSFTGLCVSDVAVNDNDDGSYTISFCPVQGGMLQFEVSINEIPAPNCSLTKQVKWFISGVHGSGDITNGGLTMNGVGHVGQYVWRIGSCSFESEVHTWKVQIISCNQNSNYNSFNYGNHTAEIGILDCDEINADIANSKKKWVYRRSLSYHNRNINEILSLTLDMENRTLNIQCNNYQFSARRVSPFFACNSPYLSISLVE